MAIEPTPAANTKIERLTEAIEDLTIAVAVSVGDRTSANPVRNFERVKDARAEIKTALTEFLQPILRLT